jgi:hypothetical protein
MISEAGMSSSYVPSTDGGDLPAQHLNLYQRVSEIQNTIQQIPQASWCWQTQSASHH